MFIKYFSAIPFNLQLPNINLKQSLSVLVWELIDQDRLLAQTTYQTYAEAELVSCLILLAGKLVRLAPTEFKQGFTINNAKSEGNRWDFCWYVSYYFI